MSELQQRRHQLAFFVLGCFLFSQASEAEEIRRGLSANQVTAIEKSIAAEMSRQKLVGVSVGVLRNGEIVFTGGAGLSNREKKTPMTTDTVVNWASNSKPVIAMLAMQLVEQGKLDLDADVRKYVPEFPRKDHTITTRQLLCHQSGLPHYSNGRVLPSPGARNKQEELNPLFAIKRFDRSPLIFVPGTKTEYSSHAYVLLSAVVQQAGGEPIASQLDQRILKLLGMASFELDVATHGQKEWAMGYRKNSAGKIIPSPEQANAWKHGAGAYKSNVNDFSKWAQAVMNQSLINAETQQLMWTRQKLLDGTSSNYGLGVRVEGSGRRLKISHNGSQAETKTRMVLYPNQKHGVVVMCNCNYADPMAISTAVYKALSTSR
ncbi:serine hydrolase domain-containing protein [Thalassoglobus polymorphus]|nr:serine hydrolase domain-containing protein [Thalassoglobus polymorphus]